jgi:hypothetical protein
MPFLDPQLVGWWKVQSIEMPEGKTLSLIGGLPGERVSFSETGHYNIYPDDAGTQRFRCRVMEPYCELDIWIKDLDRLISLCIYAIDKDVLTITVAGRPLGSKPDGIKRPTKMLMDERLNWAIIKMKRCKPPQRRGRKQAGTALKLKPGSLIPEGFLDK